MNDSFIDIRRSKAAAKRLFPPGHVGMLEMHLRRMLERGLIIETEEGKYRPV